MSGAKGGVPEGERPKGRFAHSKAKLPRIAYAFMTLAVAAAFALLAYLVRPLPSRGTANGINSRAAAKAVERAVEFATASKDRAAGQKEPTGTQKEPARALESETRSEKPVEPRKTHHALEGSSAKAVSATNAYGVLTQAIGAFEDKGYTIAFVIHDIGTGNELAYNGEEELYPASSIKAPFTASVYERLVETGDVALDTVTPVAEPTILESSDEGYRTLHRMFGEQHFIQWLKDAGVKPGSYGSYESMVLWNYPHISARTLALMWIHIYDYLATGTKPAKELADLLERREVSSLRKALDDEVVTWSKMGWFESYSNYRSEPATVEAGVVFSDNGPYVLAVMTTAPALLDELVPIHQALYRAHGDMAQGAAEHS